MSFIDDSMFGTTSIMGGSWVSDHDQLVKCSSKCSPVLDTGLEDKLVISFFLATSVDTGWTGPDLTPNPVQ